MSERRTDVTIETEGATATLWFKNAFGGEYDSNQMALAGMTQENLRGLAYMFLAAADMLSRNRKSGDEVNANLKYEIEWDAND